MAAFQTAAIIGKFSRREDSGQLRDLAAFLLQRGLSLLVETHTHETIGDPALTTADFARIAAEADIAIVVGGDGTLLSVGRSLAGSGVPLVGVNRGRLGFTTDIALDDMLPALSRILEGLYHPEDRTMMRALLSRRDRPVQESLAFNDVVASRGVQGGMIEFQVFVDGQFAYELRADGLIVATPTGSTAYALSSGGPIVHPSVAGLTMVPVSPHTLSNRPIVISDRSIIEIVVLQATEGSVYFDGRDHDSLLAGDRLEIGIHPHPVRLLHPTDYSYYRTLREKLGWSGAL